MNVIRTTTGPHGTEFLISLSPVYYRVEDLKVSDGNHLVFEHEWKKGDFFHIELTAPYRAVGVTVTICRDTSIEGNFSKLVIETDYGVLKSSIYGVVEKQDDHLFLLVKTPCVNDTLTHVINKMMKDLKVYSHEDSRYKTLSM